MSQYFYSGQIRRFLGQFIRVMSGFKVQFGRDANGNEVFRVVPCTYGDPSRQVAQIMRSNSANTSLTVPQISCYITGLKYARERIQEPYFVKKVQVIERAVDPATGEYTSAPGDKYTVERLMPVPFDLSVKADIWTTSTDQKLQLIEQIGVLFNPSLEIQGSDTFLDWTSLSYIELEDISWSSRSVPVGTEDPIDIASMSFNMPIWLSAPAKVKKMGVITNIIDNLYDASGDVRADLAEQGFTAEDFILDIRLKNSGSTMDDFADSISSTGGTYTQRPDPITGETVYRRADRNPRHRFSLPFEVIVLNGVARAVRQFVPTSDEGPNELIVSSTYALWNEILPLTSTAFQDGITRLYLRQSDDVEVVGVVSLDPTDNTRLLFTVDADTIPSNTQDAINKIIDPLKTGPGAGLPAKALGQRYLLLDDIGASGDASSAVAWRGADSTELVAKKHDIIEYNGSHWVISLEAATATVPEYVTNLNNGQQFKWDGYEWLRSWEGVYGEGEWRIH